MKINLINARSYKGTETSSDHRVVICRMSIEKYKIFKNNTNQQVTKHFDINELAKSEEKQIIYQYTLDQKLQQIESNNYRQLEKCILSSAAETIGYRKKFQNQRTYNPEVEILSNNLKQLRLQFSENKDPVKIKQLKQQRNLVLHEISKKLNEDKNNELDQIAEKIDKSKDNTKMYQAVKQLKRKPLQNANLIDDNGKSVTDPDKIYNIIRNHFKSHLTEESTNPIEPHTDEPRPLNKSISIEEVQCSIKKLKNNRATDNIAPQLLKYSSP